MSNNERRKCACGSVYVLCNGDDEGKCPRCHCEFLSIELEKKDKALNSINTIRNSIVGLQTVNWSEHVFPLVAALNEAGYQGEEYAITRENMKTLIALRDELIGDIREVHGLLHKHGFGEKDSKERRAFLIARERLRDIGEIV